MQRKDIILTEDIILYLLYQKLNINSAQLFFKLKHNISPMRDVAKGMNLINSKQAAKIILKWC